MDFLDKELQKYIEKHTSEGAEVLQELDRETYDKVMAPRMLSGHLQGRVLAMLCHMIKPKQVLEIGTFTGYSALCFAEAMSQDSKVTTIDVNEELEDMVRKYIAKSDYQDMIDYHVGNAIDIIPQLTNTFDLVFIDADKVNYSNYFDLVIDKIPTGGFVIADNVLWNGKVLDKNRKKMDKDTEAIVAFNKKVHEDSRVENVLFPIRDGLMVLRKI
jgi:predicted O-methyltransferase YrrM